MEKSNKTLHSFKVTPKTFERGLTEYIRESNNCDERRYRNCDERKRGTIGTISKCKNHPRSKYNLCNNTKYKILPRNKGKEHRIHDNKWNKWQDKYPRDDDTSQDFIKIHACYYITSKTILLEKP